MIYVPILFFAAAAILGVTLVNMKRTGKGMPISLARVHGLFAAVGLVALILNVVADSANTLMNISLGLFVIVGLGGFTLVSFHLRKKALPEKLIVIHGVGAIVSFMLILVAAFNH